MGFENIKKGIRLLKNAVIFELVAASLSVLGIAFSATGSTVGVGGGMVLVLVGLVFSIVAFIQKLRGLIAADKDEKDYDFNKKDFNAALWYVIFGIIAAVIFAFLEYFISGTVITVISQIVQGMLNIFYYICICNAVSNVFTEKNMQLKEQSDSDNSDMDSAIQTIALGVMADSMGKKCSAASKVFVITFGCATVIEICMSTISFSGIAAGIILGIAALALNVFAHIRLFLYLKEALNTMY